MRPVGTAGQEATWREFRGVLSRSRTLALRSLTVRRTVLCFPNHLDGEVAVPCHRESCSKRPETPTPKLQRPVARGGPVGQGLGTEPSLQGPQNPGGGEGTGPRRASE